MTNETLISKNREEKKSPMIRPRGIEVSRRAVIAEDLIFGYPGEKRRALNSVSFCVEKNEFFGIIGPNGAGKTTLMAILAALLRPQSGSLQILGNDARRHPRRIRADIGLVPQESTLYPSLTVKENLMYFGGLYGFSGRRLKERVSHCIDMVDLSGDQDRKVKHFSGGMKRRASIALGVVGSPKILLLDEPAANIDVHSRRLIFDKLMALKQKEMTIIYTTHMLTDVEALCDWVMILDRGRPIAGGRPSELVDKAECNSFETLFLELTEKNSREQDTRADVSP